MIGRGIASIAAASRTGRNTVRMAAAAALLLAGTAGALAQDLTKPEARLVDALEGLGIDVGGSGLDVVEAFSLCPFVLVRDAEFFAGLDASDWSVTGIETWNANPYYRAYEATRDLERRGYTSLFLGREVYPGEVVSFCSHTHSGALGGFTLDAVAEVLGPDFGVFTDDAAGTYAAWRLDIGQNSFLGRAEMSQASLYIQYTLIETTS